MTIARSPLHDRVSLTLALVLLGALIVALCADGAGHVPLFLLAWHGCLLISIAMCVRPMLVSVLHPGMLRPLWRRLHIVALLLTVALWGLTVAATFDFFTLRVYMQDTPTAEQRALRAQAEPSAPAEAAPRPAAVDLSRYSVPDERPARDD